MIYTWVSFYINLIKSSLIQIVKVKSENKIGKIDLSTNIISTKAESK
jgi:hypothetical protein